MPDDLKEWTKETAKQEGRSVNNLIVHLLNGARAAAGGEIGVQAPAAEVNDAALAGSASVNQG